MKLCERTAEVLIGICILAFAVAALLIIPGQIEAIEGASPGPRTLPTFYAWGMLALSLLLIVRGILYGSRDKIVLSITKKEILLVIFALAAMCACTFALEYLPYVPVTAVTLAVMMWVFGLRNYVTIGLVAVGFPVLVSLFFKYVLRLMLP